MSRRIARVTAGVLVLLVAVGTAATVALLDSASTVNRLSSGFGPASDANRAALTYMLDVETGIRGYALTGRATSLQPYREALPRVVPSLAAVDQSLADVGDHGLAAAVADERRLALRWIDEVARPGARSAAAAKRTAETQTAKRLFDAFRAANAAVSRELDRKRTALRISTDDQRQMVIPVVIGATVAALLLSGLVAWLTARGVSRPLTAVWKVVRRLESGDLTARADETAGPAEVRDLSAAVNSLAVERRRVQAGQRADDWLRRELRGVTSAIRIGQDPHTIAHALVVGLGEIFAVDEVSVRTFDDPRVPMLAEIWCRDGKGGPPDDPPDAAAALRGVANRLWHGAGAIGIADHREPAGGVDAHLALVPQAARSRASIIAAIGEGRTALGLLWLSVRGTARAWTAAEIGLVQHVAAELAQNLVQNAVLTQQREAVRKLREADEAKTALVSTVSHELRTPLTSIVGYLDLLLDLDAESLPPGVPDMLRVIERNALRLRALIEDLLTQSQIEAGLRILVLDRIDLVDVLAGVEETIVPLADHAGLDFAVELPGRGGLVVDGDARQLGQAVTNLVANAVKFTPAGGRVGLAARWVLDDGGEAALIEVSDTGMGIPPDEVPQLFSRFFRASNAREAVIPGTGLGLAIVREIVAQHRATIEVDTALGVGTTFVIRIPLAAGAAATTA